MRTGALRRRRLFDFFLLFSMVGLIRLDIWMGGIEELSSFCSFLILEVLTERNENNKRDRMIRDFFFLRFAPVGGKV